MPDWQPAATSMASAQIGHFARDASRQTGLDLHSSYEDLWAWSVNDPAAFWSIIWQYFDLPAWPVDAPVLAGGLMPAAVWFPGVELNYAAEVFRGRDDNQVAVIAVDERLEPVEVTWRELRRQVASLAAALGGLGVGVGDRVVGYLPNGVEAVVAFLASASVGAVWAVCGMDYAEGAARARLSQLEPRVLITGRQYLNAGRIIDRRSDVDALRRALPTLMATIVVVEPGTEAGTDEIAWSTVTSRTDIPFAPAQLPFDHPLWVLFTSGTTGRPKGLVHGHGGIVVEHKKYVALHLNLHSGQRIFWHTTPSWMMWNLLVGTLLVGSCIVCYEGSPGYPAPGALWSLAERLQVSIFGTSPSYLSACRRSEAGQLVVHPWPALTLLGVTGSTFPGDLQRWVAAQLGDRVQIASSSGGTDVCTAFAASSPITPVWAGQLSGPCLGVDLACFDALGRPVVGEVGELVIRGPMPSMPLRFWDDSDGRRYRETYFTEFDGSWRHGDWVTITQHGSVIIHGRSDATLNRHGIRMGSADITDPAESLPEVREALVIGLEEEGGGYDMPMFVTLAAGVDLDEGLRDRIRQAIRRSASPRHVPDDIIAVPGIPHTRTGKKLEIPLRRILRGEAPEQCLDPTGVDDPYLLDWYADLGARRRAARANAAGSAVADRRADWRGRPYGTGSSKSA